MLFTTSRHTVGFLFIVLDVLNKTFISLGDTKETTDKGKIVYKTLQEITKRNHSRQESRDGRRRHRRRRRFHHRQTDHDRLIREGGGGGWDHPSLRFELFFYFLLYVECVL